MCCRLTVGPLVPHLATLVLQIGEFQPVLQGVDYPLLWERKIPAEKSVVRASLEAPDLLNLNIFPAIAVFDDHFNKRISAGVFFEIAAKYAEKVGGEVKQRANVTGCRTESGSDLLLACYPHTPLTFDRLCRGFQAVLLATGRPPAPPDDEPIAY